jgi:hypothetical protein
VRSSTGVIHTEPATGQRQTLIFTLPDGRHPLLVTATDRAGRTSEEASVTVVIDTVAPEPATITVTPADRTKAYTTLVVHGEPDTTYRLTVADTSHTGRLKNGQATVTVALLNGDHSAAVTLTDRAGNQSTPADQPFTVAVPAPDPPALTLGSNPSAIPVVLTVDAAAHTQVIVRLAGEAHEQTITVDESGDVTFDVDDGRYVVIAQAIDANEQHSNATIINPIIVDTRPPGLQLEVDDTQLAAGLLAFTAVVDEHDAVLHIAGDLAGLTRELTFTGQPIHLAVIAPNGTHSFTVTVTDKYGNSATHQFTATVTRPLRLPSAFLGLGGLQLLAALVLGGLQLVAALVGLAFLVGTFVWQRARQRRGPSTL